MTLHRCTDAECPFVGQRTDKGCSCHKTDEQVLREQAGRMYRAIAELEKAFVNPGDGRPFEDGEVPEIDEARAIINEYAW